MNYFDHYVELNDLSPEARRKAWISNRIQFAPLLPDSKDAPILDFGCGAGVLLEWLTEAMGYKNATGIDVDEGQVAHARKIGQNAYVVSDAARWIREQKPFDVILMTDVLEHIPDSDVVPNLRAIYECLSPQGMLIVRVPNAGSITAAWQRYQDVTHRRLYTEESLLFTLRSAGFSTVSIHGDDVWRPGSVRGAALIAAKAASRLLLRFQYVAEMGWLGFKPCLAVCLIGVAGKESSNGGPRRAQPESSGHDG